VEAVLETWRIDNEWWRERPVSRVYYRLVLEDGRTVTVYRDGSGRWAGQSYLGSVTGNTRGSALACQVNRRAGRAALRPAQPSD